MKNDFYHFICGKLLGDGSMTKQGNRKARFQFMHRAEDFKWTNHCYELLKNLLSLNPPAYKKVNDPRLKKGYSESFVVQSKTSPVITALYEQWYPHGKKKLPFDFLEQYLNEQALAWWYQDDGHLKVVNNVAQKVILSTDSFTAEENTWLLHYLFRKFHLKFLKDGKNRLILYDQFQITYFLHLISPWLHESMNRKALPKQPTKAIAKRTTIYLPENIKLQNPTSEINEKLHHLKALFTNGPDSICNEFIFDTFKLFNSKEQPVKSYQIVIQENHRYTLASIRQQTGLTVSKLVEYCFSI